MPNLAAEQEEKKIIFSTNPNQKASTLFLLQSLICNKQKIDLALLERETVGEALARWIKLHPEDEEMWNLWRKQTDGTEEKKEMKQPETEKMSSNEVTPTTHTSPTHVVAQQIKEESKAAGLPVLAMVDLSDPAPSETPLPNQKSEKVAPQSEQTVSAVPTPLSEMPRALSLPSETKHANAGNTIPTYVEYEETEDEGSPRPDAEPDLDVSASTALIMQELKSIRRTSSPSWFPVAPPPESFRAPTPVAFLQQPHSSNHSEIILDHLPAPVPSTSFSMSNPSTTSYSISKEDISQLVKQCIHENIQGLKGSISSELEMSLRGIQAGLVDLQEKQLLSEKKIVEMVEKQQEAKRTSQGETTAETSRSPTTHPLESQNTTPSSALPTPTTSPTPTASQLSTQATAPPPPQLQPQTEREDPYAEECHKEWNHRIRKWQEEGFKVPKHFDPEASSLFEKAVLEQRIATELQEEEYIQEREALAIAVFKALEVFMIQTGVGGNAFKGLGKRMTRFVQSKKGLRHALKKMFHEEKDHVYLSPKYSLITPLLHILLQTVTRNESSYMVNRIGDGVKTIQKLARGGIEAKKTKKKLSKSIKGFGMKMLQEVFLPDSDDEESVDEEEEQEIKEQKNIFPTCLRNQ